MTYQKMDLTTCVRPWSYIAHAFLRRRLSSSARGGLTHTEVRARALLSYLPIVFTVNSDTEIPREDRSRLATVCARTPDHQLGLRGRVDVPQATESTILRIV
jgi:hypothetical protein